MLMLKKLDFLCGFVSSNEKERIDMKLEKARMKQEIVDMKLKKARMKQEIADMKLEKARMKQEIVDMKHEIADMMLGKAGMKCEINTLTFDLQRFPGSNDDIGFYTGFPSYSTPTSFYEFLLPSATLLKYWGSDNTENRPST